MSHNIEDLRDRLFDALDGLADEKKPLAVERAKAIADVARVIVDSAKAEIELVKATNGRRARTEFIPVELEPDSGPRRLLAGGCPSCGGRVRPETNGNGGLVDRCVKCGKAAPAAPKAAISAKSAGAR